MMTSKEILEEFDSIVSTVEIKRELIRALLNLCTKDEVALFNRMYESVDVIPEEKMRHAYFQCKNTVENRKVK